MPKELWGQKGCPFDPDQLRKATGMRLQLVRVAVWASPSKAMGAGLSAQCIQKVGSLPQWALNFWTWVGPVIPFLFPIFSLFEWKHLSYVCHVIVFGKHVAYLMSQVHSWNPIHI